MRATVTAKKAAKRGPVVITDRGRPAHVLLSIEQYQRLAGGGLSLLHAVAQRGAPDFAFKPPRLGAGRTRPTPRFGLGPQACWLRSFT